jgi:hypothetical protein
MVRVRAGISYATRGKTAAMESNGILCTEAIEFAVADTGLASC